MEKTNGIKFEHNGFGKRLKSMLSVDFRRMFTMPLFYIMAGIAAAIPILILVMTTAVGGSVSVDPITSVETTLKVEPNTNLTPDLHSVANGAVETTVEMEPITNTWQAVESISGESSGMSSDIMSMCNSNLIFFMAAVLVCIFVADDFRSGYVKNLFAVRSKKTDYVISKSLVGFVGGAFMILTYFIGAILGGAIAGLSFDPGAAGIEGIVMCLLSKALLMAVFVPIYLLMGVVGKQKLWLSMVGSFVIGMLFFMMIPALTPLDSGVMNVILCLAGGVLFSIGFGAVSNSILQKTSLV